VKSVILFGAGHHQIDDGGDDLLIAPLARQLWQALVELRALERHPVVAQRLNGAIRTCHLYPPNSRTQPGQPSAQPNLPSGRSMMGISSVTVVRSVSSAFDRLVSLFLPWRGRVIDEDADH